jgi:hypothetical protein
VQGKVTNNNNQYFNDSEIVTVEKPEPAKARSRRLSPRNAPQLSENSSMISRARACRHAQGHDGSSIVGAAVRPISRRAAIQLPSTFADHGGDGGMREKEKWRGRPAEIERPHQLGKTHNLPGRWPGGIVRQRLQSRRHERRRNCEIRSRHSDARISADAGAIISLEGSEGADAKHRACVAVDGVAAKAEQGNNTS